MKKKGVLKRVTALSMALGICLSSATTAFANELPSPSWSDRWEVDSNDYLGRYKVKSSDGSGYLINCWFQDSDGSWYLLDNNGDRITGYVSVMYTDNKYYFDHSSYGEMLTVDGYYDIEGGMYLTFNHEHDGSWGSIISGYKATNFNEGVLIIDSSEYATITFNDTEPAANIKPKTGNEEQSIPSNANRPVTSEDMQRVTDSLEEYTHKQAVETFRQTAKTEVARLQAEGNPEFDGITDEMIDNYTEEELNALMVKIYQNLKY